MYRLKPCQIFKAIDIFMEGDKRLTKIMILLSFHFLPLRSFFNKKWFQEFLITKLIHTQIHHLLKLYINLCADYGNYYVLIIIIQYTQLT